MKKTSKNFIFLIIMITLFTEKHIAQVVNVPVSLNEFRADIRLLGIDPDNKQQVLDSLYSLKDLTRYRLYRYCGAVKILEALPHLKVQFQNHPYTYITYQTGYKTRFSDERTDILRAVVDMKGDGFQQELRMELDSLQDFLDEDKNDFIIFASFLMEKYQDDYGFNTIIKFYTTQEYLSKILPVGFLSPFYNSSHKTEVINALKYIFQECTDVGTREYTLEQLLIVPDPQFESFAYTTSRNDTTYRVRDLARKLLGKMHSPYYMPSLINGLEREHGRRREWYYDELLRSGQLWAYKYVRDLYQNNTYPSDYSVIRSMLSNYKYLVEWSIDPDINGSLDTLKSALLQAENLGWLGNHNFIIELNSDISIAKSNLTSKDSIGCARQIKNFLQEVDQEYRDSLDGDEKFVTKEGWEYFSYNPQNILYRLPQIPPSGFNIKLINSTGTKLTGGSLQYYEGAWKDAVNNNDGTFFVNTTAKTLSLRMTYEHGTQTKSNVSISNDTIVFQTVNAQIQLQNSQGVLIDTGTVQYYAGAWRTFGTTNNGTTNKELLPNKYTFRMTYAFASNDKQQDISTSPVVIFQTKNTAVQLQNSQGNLIDTGVVQYYSGAWRIFGTTNNGTTNKELLPNNYSFRMNYAYASKDKQQDITTNQTVVFQTINASVQLKNSLGNLMPAPSGDQGTVQYYSGAWRNFGTTNNGTTNKELLPNNYSFRMTYAYASLDKAQDISTNNVVSFATVLCTINAKDAQNLPVNNALANYYSGAWRVIGATANGLITKELLPVNLTFRLNYNNKQQDKAQNLLTNNVVEFVVQ